MLSISQSFDRKGGAEMLTFGLYALAYLVFGHIYSKIDNAVYFDNTPTKKLRIPKRFIRTLLFPCASDKWEKREEHFNEYGGQLPPISLRTIIGVQRIGCADEAKEKYCKYMIFLWPLKLFPIACASAYFIVQSIIFLGSVPYKLLSACVNSAGNLKSFAAKKLPRLSGIIAEEAEALEVADLFIEARNSVMGALAATHEHEEELENNKREWQDLKTKCLAGADSGRADAVLGALEPEIKRVGGIRANFQELIDNMIIKERQLRDAVQEMALLRKTAFLSVAVASPVSSGDTFVKSDGIAVLMSRNINDTRKLITDARKILKEAEDIKL